MKALFFLRRRLSMQRLHGYLFLEIKIRPCLCNDRSKKRKKVVEYEKTDFPVSIVGFIGVCLCAEPVYVGFVPE